MKDYGEKMKQKKLENFEDAGCPFFFDEDCGAKITETIFNKYCLDRYQECHTYQFIQKDGERYVGSKK